MTTTAGNVFAACSTETATRLALAAGGVRYSTLGNFWRDKYEWRFADGSVLHAGRAFVGYGEPGDPNAVRVPQ